MHGVTGSPLDFNEKGQLYQGRRLLLADALPDPDEDEEASSESDVEEVSSRPASAGPTGGDGDWQHGASYCRFIGQRIMKGFDGAAFSGIAVAFN